jgi:hypothetical protein
MSSNSFRTKDSSDLCRRLSEVVQAGRLVDVVNARRLSDAANSARRLSESANSARRLSESANSEGLCEVESPTPPKSRMKLICQWFSTESRQLIRMKLMSSTALNWMSYSSCASVERLHQIQMAWFDYRRTIKIKLDLFITQKKRLLMQHWFLLKRRKEKKKTLRRMLQWAAKRV